MPSEVMNKMMSTLEITMILCTLRSMETYKIGQKGGVLYGDTDRSCGI